MLLLRQHLRGERFSETGTRVRGARVRVNATQTRFLIVESSLYSYLEELRVRVTALVGDNPRIRSVFELVGEADPILANFCVVSKCVCVVCVCVCVLCVCVSVCLCV